MPAGQRHNRDADDAELWAAVSDLFGAMKMIFIVLFMLAAALVGSRTIKTIRAENTTLRDEKNRLMAELEKLHEKHRELKKHDETSKSVIQISNVLQAVVMRPKMGNPGRAKYELLVEDPLGGIISRTQDRSTVLSNRGASWVSADAEQIVAEDASSSDTNRAFPGTYKVRLAYQKGSTDTDTVVFRVGQMQPDKTLKAVHETTRTYDQLRPIQTTIDVLEYTVDDAGRVSSVRDL